MSVTQLRPWMSHTGNNVHPFEEMVYNKEYYPRGLIVCGAFKNTGHQPAIDVYVRNELLVAPYGAHPEFPDLGPRGVPAVIPPGHDTATNWMVVGPEDKDRFFAHEVAIYLYCIISYRDPSTPEIERLTECCFEIRYFGEQIGEDGVRRVQTSATPANAQNRMT